MRWSGSTNAMVDSLERRVEAVEHLGPSRPLSLRLGRLASVLIKHSAGRTILYELDPIVARAHARVMGRRLVDANVDVLFAPAAGPEIAYLDTELPIVYSIDLSFRQLASDYHQVRDALSWSQRRAESVEMRAMRRSSAIVVPTPWAADSFRDDYGVPETRLHVVPFGANLDEEPPADVGGAIEPAGPCELLFVGMDWVRKGGDIALETLDALRRRGLDARLTIVGCRPPDGTARDGVTVVPFLDKADPVGRRALYDLYARGHFLVVPTRGEAFGIVFAEAAAFGLPSLAPDVGGLSHVVVPGRTGILMRPEDRGEAYADAIMDLWGDALAYRQLREAARREYERSLNWDAWGDAVVAILDRAVREAAEAR